MPHSENELRWWQLFAIYRGYRKLGVGRRHALSLAFRALWWQ
jgi:hypothetical protein